MVKETPNTSKSVTATGASTNKPKRIKKVRKPKKPKFNFQRKIHAVLKSLNPEGCISKRAMGIVNDFMGDIFEKLASESRILLSKGKTATLTSREMMTSAKLVLQGDLSKHGVSEATKAIQKYVENTKG
jgi:histone H2B